MKMFSRRNFREQLNFYRSCIV